MRYTRNAVVIAAAMSLLILGCSDDSDDTTESTVEVTGTEKCSYVGVEEGLSEYHCEEVASDPRVSGQALALVDWDRASGDISGTHELVNDEGSWFGPVTGLDDETHGYIDGLLEGRGAYDGLQYRFHVEADDAVELGLNLVTGTIEPMP